MLVIKTYVSLHVYGRTKTRFLRYLPKNAFEYNFYIEVSRNNLQGMPVLPTPQAHSSSVFGK